MALEFLLQFAGTSFVLDTARVIRLKHQSAEQEDLKNIPALKHQPLEDIIDEIERLISSHWLNDFNYPDYFPGRNLSAIAQRDEHTNTKPNIGSWFYPNTASRWSVFRGLATSSQVRRMVANTQGRTAATFFMAANPISPDNPTNNAVRYTVTTRMHMLPARPLGETAGNLDGLYLVTLVDERFYFPGTPLTIHPRSSTTWVGLIQQIATLLGITIQVPIVDIAYTRPEVDSQLWANQEDAGKLLDAIAFNLGRVVVRGLDGIYRLLTPVESDTIVENNRGQVLSVVRTAGGDIFNSGTLLPVGNLTPAINAIVPEEIFVTFPYYVIGNDPVPHFANTRYQNQRPSTWFEDSYGDVFRVRVPITSGGNFVQDLQGRSQQTIHDTAKALVSGEAFIGALPLNFSGLTSLAMRVARDRYESLAVSALDEVYPGTFAWIPEGIHDIVWTYSAKHAHGQATTRVMRPSWTCAVNEMQHGTPPLSGYTSTPPGVGGPSVSQTITDSYGLSGVLTSGIAVNLRQTFNSGDFVAFFDKVSHLPTDNRWKGRIDGEDILFEGTSGLREVGVVYRGIDGTLQVMHDNQKSCLWLTPDSTYGVNLVSYNKGMFSFPGAHTSGGVQEARIAPQVQNVFVSDGIGLQISGITHYSGLTQFYDPSQSNPWLSGDQVWAVSRMSGTALTSGTRYEGQLAGYSASGVVAPIYLCSQGGGGGSTDKLALLVSKQPADLPMFTEYKGLGVIDSDTPLILTYSYTGDTYTIYSEQNIDLPVTAKRTHGPNFARVGDSLAFPLGKPWEGVANITQSDDSYASCFLRNGEFSDYLIALSFGFNIPNDQLVVQVKVEVECRDLPYQGDGKLTVEQVQLTVGGALVGNNVADDEDVPHSDAWLVFDYPMLTWGVTPTPQQVNSGLFGVTFRVRESSGSQDIIITALVDAIRITVTTVLFDEGCVVRIRKGKFGEKDYWLMDHEPRWEYVGIHVGDGDISIDGVVYQKGTLLRWRQDTHVLEGYESVLLINVSADE